jgi:hypothetical protein
MAAIRALTYLLIFNRKLNRQGFFFREIIIHAPLTLSYAQAGKFLLLRSISVVLLLQNASIFLCISFA